MTIESVAYSRAGLIGNPSDGYFGKTIGIAVRNFAAKVTVTESRALEIIPSEEDESKYGSMQDLVRDVRAHGYYGGVRLMKAVVKRFAEHCEEKGIELAAQNFTMRYETTIPRHVGLAGSSALGTAALRSLMKFYGVEIEKPFQPGLILSVENEELGIAGGLLDRVIQVYEGCVFMDCGRKHLESKGWGKYEDLDCDLLPEVFVAYQTNLAEGSEVFHNNIRERWLRGDRDVVQAMEDFAGYAQEVRDLLAAGRGSEIGPWLDKNFDRRRSIFELASANIEMVERARSTGAHCKFAGSGGAIVGVYEDDRMYRRLEQVYEGTATVIFKPDIG